LALSVAIRLPSASIEYASAAGFTCRSNTACAGPSSPDGDRAARYSVRNAGGVYGFGMINVGDRKLPQEGAEGARTEDRGRRTEDREPRTENRGPKTEDRERKAEDRERKAEDRRQRAEDRGPKITLVPGELVHRVHRVHEVHFV